jgi:hypothetical protein
MTNYRADCLTTEALSSMPFKSLGHDVMIHERVTLVGIENISIGSHVRIDPDVTLLATGPLTIGCYTHIAAGVFITAKAGFEMKNFANIAHGARIYTINDDYSGEHLMGPTIPAELRSLSPAASEDKPNSHATVEEFLLVQSRCSSLKSESVLWTCLPLACRPRRIRHRGDGIIVAALPGSAPDR